MNPQFPQTPQVGEAQGVDPAALNIGQSPSAQAPIAAPVKTNSNSTQNALLIS
jgi:hypothetical protein